MALVLVSLHPWILAIPAAMVLVSLVALAINQPD